MRFSTCLLAPSGFVFLVTVMNHLLDCCFLHQHVTQVGAEMPGSMPGVSVTFAELISVLGFSHNLGACRKQRKEASSFGLSWICGFWCIKTRILEFNPEKLNSLLQPWCHQHQPG